MQIIVLGMHRSGTSAVARLINMMGCYFAGEGLSNGFSADNPKGYWERRDVIEVNTQLLRSIDCEWNEVSAFDLKKPSKDALRRFNSQAQTILLNLEANRPWFIKDPRLCLTFPLWRKLLEMPICLIVHRNPVEIAKSLQKRNGYSLPFGVALWEKYLLHALESSYGLNRLHVSYHELLRDPVGTVNGLFTRLSELGAAPLRRPAEQEILAFIDPELHRQRATAESINELLNPAQAELARKAESGEILEMDPVPAISAEASATLADVDNQRIETVGAVRRVEELEAQLALLTRTSSQQRRVAPLLEKQVQQLKEMVDEMDRAREKERQRDAEAVAEMQRRWEEERQHATEKGETIRQLQKEVAKLFETLDAERRQQSDTQQRLERMTDDCETNRQSCRRFERQVQDLQGDVGHLKNLLRQLAEEFDRKTASPWQRWFAPSSAKKDTLGGGTWERLQKEFAASRAKNRPTAVPSDTSPNEEEAGIAGFQNWKKQHAADVRKTAASVRATVKPKT